MGGGNESERIRQCGGYIVLKLVGLRLDGTIDRDRRWANDNIWTPRVATMPD